MNANDGVRARDYFPDSKTAWKLASSRIHVEISLSSSISQHQVVELGPNAGLCTLVVGYDEHYHAQAPTITPDGVLTVLPSGKSGESSVQIDIVNLAALKPDGTFQTVASATIVLDATQRTVIRRIGRDARALSPKRRSPTKSGPRSPSRSSVTAAPRSPTLAPTAQTCETGLSAPNIHTFRAPPPALRASCFKEVVLSLLPMLLMRQWNHHAEFVLLTDARGTAAQAMALLKKIQAAIDEGAVVEAVVPLIDAACRLHTRLGGAQNIAVAVRLAHLRVQVVGSALGIDMRAPNPIDVTTAQRLAGGRRTTIDLHVRVLVESAHLLKLVGHVHDSLKYYRTAALLASTQNETNGRGASQIPFLFATGDLHVLRGDLDGAVRSYEEARAHAELASRGSSVVAECEQHLAFVFALAGQLKESDTAIKRAHTIRREQRDQVAAAETLLYEAACLCLRGKGAQAAQCISKARELTTQAGQRSTFVRCGTEALAGVLSEFDLTDVAVTWDPEIARQCPDKQLVAFVDWLCLIRNPDVVALTALSADVESTAGPACLLHDILQLTVSIAALEDKPAEAAERAQRATESLSRKVVSTSAVLRLATETTTRAFHLAKDFDSALRCCERLVWIAQQTMPSVSYALAFRISSCVALCVTSATSHVDIHGLDDMFASLLSLVGAVEGHFSPKVVPIILDAAEVRHVRHDHPGALELFAKALRIVDVKNLLYLIGPLFLPRWLLAPTEVRDRDRLAAERDLGTEGYTALAMLLQQIGLTHEASGNVQRAISALQQAVATFEIASIEHHPGCLSALLNLGRCHLALREHANARVYVEHARELFLDHYHAFGQYGRDSITFDIRLRIDSALRASGASERSEGSVLEKGSLSHPALRSLEMYV
jgi:tetratricopeptide (TPR) repeat protein